MTPVHAFLSAKAAQVEQAMDAYCHTLTATPATLMEALRYSLFAGGKRLRPALALGAAEMVCGNDAPALPAACALEMIHTYSLIHDDLPAMDNDDWRRGKPTSHKVYGEAIAILAGDALLTMAFDVGATANHLGVIREIAQAAGAEGMVGGQVIDLQSEDKALTPDELRRLHSFKTGALIRASVRCGAMLAGATDAQLRALSAYGDQVGLAFQIADDILNLTSTQEVLGKPVGSDEAHKKSTYPSLVGLEDARRLANEAVAAAIESLDLFGPEGDMFRRLARYIVEREN